MSSQSPDPLSPIPNPPPTLSRPPISSDSESDDESQTFHDANTHFSPEDEATLVSESNAIKSEANTLFNQKHYSEAISTYDRALASCPNYLDYEIAVLKSNISACHVFLEDWKNAVDSATESLECLDRLHPLPNQGKKKKNKKQQQQQQYSKTTAARETDNDIPHEEDRGAVIEIPSDEEESTALARLHLSDTRLRDISRIRLKSLLRRAKARRWQATWASLAGSEEDYKLLLDLIKNHQIPSSPADLKTVTDALRSLPLELSRAKEKEMGEMMGKLKELGNGILKPFGLSTENFKMVKDESTGGYSMNFEQGAPGGKK
jgi:tetratricopeptide (TPR) repeat protein